jgi:hypothetical protein
MHIANFEYTKVDFGKKWRYKEDIKNANPYGKGKLLERVETQSFWPNLFD